MNNVVNIMGRLASVAEKKSGGGMASNAMQNETKNNFSQVITMYFTKQEYDTQFPVDAKKLYTPLVKYVKEARKHSKYFFSFAKRGRIDFEAEVAY